MVSEIEQKKGKEILQIINLVANEKGIDKSIIVKALESALASVYVKNLKDKDADVRVTVNPTDGLYNAIRCWEIVDDENFENSEYQMPISEAKAQGDNVEVGNFLSEDLPRDDLSRIGASQAKQIIFRLVKDAEREKMITLHEKRIGELVSGQVKKIIKDGVIVDLSDGTEAIMHKQDMIPRENFRVGDRLRGYFKEVNRDSKGPLVTISRSCDEYLVKVIRLEVPEVEEGQIEIKSISRDAGYRAKIAVKSKDARVDPIGACV
jgi:N utilization substance protein A